MPDVELDRVFEEVRRSLEGLSKRAHTVRTYSERDGDVIRVGVQHKTKDGWRRPGEFDPQDRVRTGE